MQSESSLCKPFCLCYYSVQVIKRSLSHCSCFRKLGELEEIMQAIEKRIPNAAAATSEMSSQKEEELQKKIEEKQKKIEELQEQNEKQVWP